MSDARPGADDDLVPVSVRLGSVVPPEDPEDWRRPLTWVAAIGMLGAPLVTLGWFAIEPPDALGDAVGTTSMVAAVLSAGAAATGATQQGVLRAWTATLGSALFAALAVIILGVVMAGERQVGSASPTLAHAFAAAVAGLGGAAGAAVVAAVVARLRSRVVRFAPALAVGVVVSLALVGVLLAPP